MLLKIDTYHPPDNTSKFFVKCFKYFFISDKIKKPGSFCFGNTIFLRIIFNLADYFSRYTARIFSFLTSL